MIHVALMRKEWGLTEKIMSGEKIIESRWSINRRSPWNKVNKGDKIYFKNSGEKVKIVTSVQKVIQFDNLTPKKVEEILKTYGKDDGIGKADFDFYYSLFKNRKYCILIYLDEPEAVEQEFDINKQGFGMRATWITTDKIEKVKL